MTSWPIPDHPHEVGVEADVHRVSDVPLNVEMKLEVWDSPNIAGVITMRFATPRSSSIVA